MLINIIVTTKHRGVWFAQSAPGNDLTGSTIQNLKNCRMAIYWGTKNGLQQLCEEGPTDTSKISAKADILVLHDVTAVFSVTEKAAKKWDSI